MKKKVIRIVCYILTVVLFLTGLFIFSFPLINKAMIDNHTQDELEVFRIMRTTQFENKKNNTDAESGETQVGIPDFESLLTDMQKYNATIFEDGQAGLKDAWSYQQSGFDLSSYGLYTSVIAELRIPKMNCDLPLYLGATNYNMARGAAQLGQTSVPIGGKNTNCVIAAHRGSAGGDFFKEIQKLQIGDKLYIDNLWETLTYKVERIDIITPDQVDKILIQKGRDMITLTTCHPYPYNSHRYIVYCSRTDTEVSTDLEEETSSTETQSETEIQSQHIQKEDSSNSELMIKIEYASYYFIPAILIILIIVLCILHFRRKRRLNNKQKKAETD